ncbi:MAG TPA: HAMP domain-containing sensor histidine kinase [Verrucomicrobiae bacterium]|nr:HAMP domain-containing sensor histidine kinase [Verrucomicrobiae bacterium]
MTIRIQLAVWYSVILLMGLLLIAGWTYYEMVVEHPSMALALATEGHSPMEEFWEVILFGGLPALVLALVGGWFLMARVLKPLATLTSAMEQVQLNTLGPPLPRKGNQDELDRLTEVFNRMITRLNDSLSRVREFTLHASHELKTPLTIMHGEIEIMMSQSTVTATQRDTLASQLDEIQRLSKIVEGLTLLAKADAGQVTLAQENVQLDEIVHDSFADAVILAQPQKISVSLNSCEKLSLQGDRHRLRQLLLNLTDNAIKYNQPEGRVEIGLERKNQNAQLTIANTGKGIPAPVLGRVFDRFFRGDASHSSEIEGCGLGLSIAEWIVKAHGGSIHIASEPEQTTTVTVRLPLA